MHPDNPFFIITTLCGLSFLGAAFLMWKKPPKKVNHFYGYRTRRSMSSQGNWNFAQGYSTRRMFESGVVMTGFGLADFFLPPLNMWLEIGISFAFLFIACFHMMYSTEMALKKRD